MNKTELIANTALRTGLMKKDVERAINEAIELIAQELEAGNSVKIAGFGAFEVRERAEHQARNPKTGEPVTVPSGKSIHFRPGKILKNIGAETK